MALSNYLGMMRTVLSNCPIKAEIRAVESQSDLRIFDIVMIINIIVRVLIKVLKLYFGVITYFDKQKRDEKQKEL